MKMLFRLFVVLLALLPLHAHAEKPLAAMTIIESMELELENKVVLRGALTIRGDRENQWYWSYRSSLEDSIKRSPADRERKIRADRHEALLGLAYYLLQ